MSWTAQLLEGDHVVLTPLTEQHLRPLWAIAQHESVWRYMPFAVRTFDEFEHGYFAHLRREQAQGSSMPFVTQLRTTGELVGSTSYLAVEPQHKRLEIGATWINPAHQRSAVNTEAKLLQLTDAFERLDCNRVELKTDSLNEKSQRAIARIGGVLEGTFRNHMVLPDGRIRHTVWFSLTREEWPQAKQRLLDMLHVQ